FKGRFDDIAVKGLGCLNDMHFSPVDQLVATHRFDTDSVYCPDGRNGIAFFDGPVVTAAHQVGGEQTAHAIVHKYDGMVVDMFETVLDGVEAGFAAYRNPYAVGVVGGAYYFMA